MSEALEATWRWRTGRKVFRTIYAVPDSQWPDGDGVLIGLMDSPELAAEACAAHNVTLETRQ